MSGNVFDSMFPSLLKVDDHYCRQFGSAWCGPEKFKHGNKTLVATYFKDEGSDGLDVWIYETRCPAQFYELEARPTPNSVGEIQQGFTLSTGSGHEMLELVLTLAKHITGGMLCGKE